MVVQNPSAFETDPSLASGAQSIESRRRRRLAASLPLSAAIHSVVETLEDRKLFAGDASIIQSLPYSLDFESATSGIVDRDGQATGFSWVMANKNNDEYQPGLIDMVGGRLRVTTTGTSLAGGPWENDNTLVNGLQTQFNGSGGSFSISTRLIGPLGYLNTASEQGGLLFGPDQDNYVKLVAVAQPNGTFLQFVDEQKPAGSFVHQIASANSYTNVGSFAAINTLDLTIAADASTGLITAYYRVNGGSLMQVSQTLTLSGAQKTKFFSSSARAGIIAMQKNNEAAETLVFEKFEIVPGTPQVVRPSVRSDDVTPSVSQTNVKRDSFVSAGLVLPNVGKGVDTATLNTSTVKLYRSSDRVAVPGHVSTSGAGDTITFQPFGPLDANTQYTFEVTSGVKDTGGAMFVPFSMNFTTGTAITPTDTRIAFQQVGLPTATGQQYSSVQIGPDGKLYASSLSGLIQRFNINADGTLGAPENITTVQTANGGNRFITGIVFDPSSTADNLILWVNNSQYAFEGASDWTGKLSRLSGSNLQTYQDYVTGLPRAIRDHLNNQMVFGPGGKMYFTMGSMSAMGAADSAWGLRAEHLLSAAVLQVDTAAITTRIAGGQGAVNVRTEGAATNYNPWAADAPVKIYATGVRNAYDMVYTRAGHLYAPTNGSAAGGATPASPAGGFSGTRIDQAQNGPYNAAPVPGISQVNVTEPDFLFKIEQGGYYGHPNPTRGEYVLNGGNPTDLVDSQEFTQYPSGTLPDRNYRGANFTFGKNHSPNGVIEYQGNAFDGLLDGRLLVVRYSGGADVVALSLDANGNVTEQTAGISGLSGFVNPLDLTQDLSNGNLYIVDYGAQKIVLAKPVAPGARITVDTTTMRFNDDYGGSNTTPSPTRYVKITNTGTAPLAIPNTGITLSNTSNWLIVSKPGLPATVAPGESVLVGIAFKATSATGTGIKTATLTITSSDSTNPSVVVNLRGLAAAGTGGMNEPSLQRILDLYQIPVQTGDTNPGNTNLFSNSEPLSSNEEVQAQRFVKAGGGSITIEPLAAYAGGTPAVKFGYYQAGTADSRTELVSISAADAQSVNPTLNGTTSFDPGSNRFGLYAYFPIFNNYAYSEDSLNTKENTVALRQKFRFYPLKNADGSVVPNAYIFTNEDFNNDPSGATDSNDFVGIIRNVTPSNSGPEFGLENTDTAPFPDRLVFSRVHTQPPDLKTENGVTFQPPNNVVHDTAILRVRNTGSAAMTVNSLTLSNSTAWTIINPPANGTQIAAGGFLDITVKFIATTVPNYPGFNPTTDPSGGAAAQSGFYNGTMTIGTNDADEPTSVVQLAGWWQNKSEKNQEPSLPVLVNNILGYGTKVLNNGQTMADGWNGANVLGDEVISPYWVRADGSAPVEVKQLAAWHGQGDTATVRWAPYAYPTSLSVVLTHDGEDGQSILPRGNGASTLAAGTFKPLVAANNPLGAFQFKIEGEWSDDSMQKPVASNPSDNGHHVRFWPAKDKTGAIIPNTWIMGMDYIGINYDYQDNLYLVTNMKPMPPAAPANLTATGQPNGIALDWPDSTNAPLLTGYNVYRAASSSGPWSKINASPVSDSQYLDTTASSGVSYFYRVTATDSWQGESATSNTVSAIRTTDNVPPAAPQGLSGVGVGNGAALSWQPNNDSDLAGYRIYRTSTVGGTYSLVNTASLVNLTSYTDTTATPGATYYYHITAVDFSGNESPASLSVTVVAGDQTAPAIPTGVAANNASTGLAVSWSPVAESDVVGYRVYRSSTIDGTYTVVSGGSPVTGSTWTDTTAQAGETWFYRVDAIDASNNMSAMSDAASATRLAVTVPTIRINAGGGAYTDADGVTWQADQYYTGGTAAVSNHDVAGTTDDLLYLARRWGAYTYAIPTANGQYTLNLHFSDPLYTAAGKRKFTVKAEGVTILDNFDLVAAAGAGKLKYVKSFDVTISDGFLNLQTIKILDNPIISAIELIPKAADTTPPAMPTSLAANGTAPANVVTWTAVNDADLAGYNIYRSDSPSGTFVKLNGSALTAASYNDTTAAIGVTSYYRVTAVDSSGNESAFATTSALRPAGDTTAPAAVTGVVASPSSTAGINVAWSASGASDFATYNLYRSASASGPWTRVNSAKITATSFADPTAPENTTSYYYVTAVDTSGNESDASTTASATAPVFANGTGLYGKFYAGTYFNTLKLGRMDGVINFDWGAGSPATGVPADNFTARWMGKIKAGVTGAHTFTVRASDGVKLWVNGVLIIDQFVAGNTRDIVSTPINLVAGQKYDIRLEYLETTGAASVKMYWEAPGLAKEIVQRGYLFSA